MIEDHAQTGLDSSLRLDAVYYSAPVPRDLATLTVLGAVFDKVYFPGVHMPIKGFDQAELDKEITRITEVTQKSPGRSKALIGILKFVRHAKILDGFCVFTSDGEIRSDIAPHGMVDGLFQAIHGPHPEGWQPIFENNHSKAMPGSEEAVLYPGDYHYMAGAVLHSGHTGIPLLNDTPSLPVPLVGEAQVDRAKHLSTMLAIECVKLALPDLPLLWPDDLMEFRAANHDALRVFRRSLLRYAGSLNGKLANAPHQEIEAMTKFFVATEIAPALDELKAKMSAPARPWYKRGIDAVKIAPNISPSFYTMDPASMLGAALAAYVPQFFTELTAVGEKREALKKSGLYYLLQLETFHSKNRPD